MENHLDTENEKSYLVLQKFINLIVFGNTKNPNFLKSNTAKIHKALLNFYDAINVMQDEERTEFINQFYHKMANKFRKAMNDQDVLDLMNCYGFSDFRTIINIFRMLGDSPSRKPGFDPQNHDIELYADLVWSVKLPNEIRGYLSMQFFDFFKNIPYLSKEISTEQYQFLVNRYVCKYDYNKAINIFYQNYGEVN